MHPFVEMLLAAGGLLLFWTAGHCADVPENHRTGTKQGPLLMIDDIVSECQQFLRLEGGSVEPDALGWMAEEIRHARERAADLWRVPAAPPAPENGLVFKPPFGRGCCTASGGPGHALTPPGTNRGELAVELLAGNGRYAYAVDSPCLNFRPTVDGIAECRTAVVVNGIGGVDTGLGGHALSRLGVWIAHCHPKTEGRYSEKVAWQLRDVSGAMRFENSVLTHEASMPVKAGVDYAFGTGISAACAATQGATAGLKVRGRLAWFTVQFVPKADQGGAFEP